MVGVELKRTIHVKNAAGEALTVE